MAWVNHRAQHLPGTWSVLRKCDYYHVCGFSLFTAHGSNLFPLKPPPTLCPPLPQPNIEDIWLNSKDRRTVTKNDWDSGGVRVTFLSLPACSQHPPSPQPMVLKGTQGNFAVFRESLSLLTPRGTLLKFKTSAVPT